jgi:hypothetical protein
MIDDEILDGSCCSICWEQFTDTENAVLSHGHPVVCLECWRNLTEEKRIGLKKAFFYTRGYVFNIDVILWNEIHSYTIKPLHNIDQIVYEVHENGLLCVVGLNSKANWDVDRPFSNHIVYEIGKAIDKVEND